MSEELSLFFGRFHPVLVHLPIGLIIALAALELTGRSKRFAAARGSIGFLLALAVPISAFSALLGWLLSKPGGYDTKLLDLHFWTGIATTLCLGLAALFYFLDQKKIYRFVLAGTFMLLLVASHFGGSLTHGSDYLVEYAPAPLKTMFGRKPPQPELPAEADPVVFTAAIQPILSDYCAGCHGPEKSKGDLRVDSHPAILVGGETGPSIVPGKSAESLLLKRMRLPLEDEDHMPPEGKPQPTPEEMALLAWWVDAGAPLSNRVSELKPPANIARLIRGMQEMEEAPPVEPEHPPEPLEEILPRASELANKFNIAVLPISQTDPWLQVNASIAGTNFGDASLLSLSNLAANIRWLDLAGTAVSDASIPVISAMKNLERLHLQKTSISDEGLARLEPLPELTYLNLYATSAGDAALESLQSQPKLRQLYLWQSQVTPEAATNYARTRMNPDQIRQWEAQIAELQENIRKQQVVVDLGAPVMTPPSFGNTNCPVSGKPVDPARTALYAGKLVAFCCDDCRAAFQKEPSKYASKLQSAEPKPINAKCPITDKDVDPAHTTVYEGKTIAFCCGKCRTQFRADPKPFLSKLGLQEE